uniref:Uncharacterized protein n=1 Tax=Aegilops tauschii subsp. strangulata TaxID=200361 RepID=A0A453IBC7_AEGTS
MGSIIMRIMTSVIEAWRLLDSVRRRFGDDVPAAGQEECFHAFNLHVHDVILDAHLQATCLGGKLRLEGVSSHSLNFLAWPCLQY